MPDSPSAPESESISATRELLAAWQQREHGLLRQYLPRTVDMRDYAQADFDAIADRPNGRSRQTLGFKTPSEALAEVLR